MTQTLVKLLTNEDGEKCRGYWHYVHVVCGSPALLCSGEVFGEGEGRATYEHKTAERGITCPNCLDFIRELKGIKL